MRYRTLGHGMPVSAIALTVDKRAGQRGAHALAALISGAMEAGVNAFHLECSEPEILETVGRALAPVERRLLFVSLRLGLSRRLGQTALTRDFSPNGLTGAVDEALALTDLGYLDLVVLDRPREYELPATGLKALMQQRDAGRIGLIGIAGAHDAVDDYLDVGVFDVLASPHHPGVGAKELERIKAAAHTNLGVIAYGYFPEFFHEPFMAPAAPKVAGAPEPHPLAGAGTFAFLHETTNWTAEELCLAYALLDPTISTVLVRAHDLGRLEALAAVPERDLPPGMGAKVEMARFDMQQAMGPSGVTDVVAPLDCIVPYHEVCNYNIHELFDALKSNFTSATGGFSGAIKPKAENIFNDCSRYLSGETVVERSGRILQAVSPANRSLRSPAPDSSLWAKRARKPDPLSAEARETPQIPPIDEAPFQPPQAAEPGAAQPVMAIWRSKDFDYPVQPTGENFPGPEGRTYLKVDFNGTLTFVPADEMVYPEGMTPPQPAPPAEQPKAGPASKPEAQVDEPPGAGGGEQPARSRFGERLRRVADGR